MGGREATEVLRGLSAGAGAVERAGEGWPGGIEMERRLALRMEGVREVGFWGTGSSSEWSSPWTMAI